MGTTVGASHRTGMHKAEELTLKQFRRIQGLIDAGFFDPTQRARNARLASFDAGLARQMSSPLVEARLRASSAAAQELADASVEASGGAFGGFGTRASTEGALRRLADQTGAGVAEASTVGVQGALDLSKFNAGTVNQFALSAIQDRFAAEQARLAHGLAAYQTIFAGDRQKAMAPGGWEKAMGAVMPILAAGAQGYAGRQPGGTQTSTQDPGSFHDPNK